MSSCTVYSITILHYTCRSTWPCVRCRVTVHWEDFEVLLCITLVVSVERVLYFRVSDFLPGTLLNGCNKEFFFSLTYERVIFFHVNELVLFVGCRFKNIVNYICAQC